ncbi:hypothetical protein AAVH_07075 [Aphelenchoides avenae]|nr:hypothetical protein AAVH_07075 [Aphelenchus avenae]
MPLYYDQHLVSALVFTTICIVCFAYYGSSWFWLLWLFKAADFLPCLLIPFYYLWLQPPGLQLNNAAPANGNAAQLQRGGLQHLPVSPRMLADIFQCLPRVALDVCQLVSRQFRDAVEDARTTLPLYSMRVCLSPFETLVGYDAWIDDVGFVAGHFFTGLRRCDLPYFRNAAIALRTKNPTYVRTSTDMISAFVRWRNLDERNILFTALQCEAYADELVDLFRFTDRLDIRWMHVIYKRSLITPGRDFLSTLFAEARKRSLSTLTVSLASVKAKNCVLNEIIQDQKRPSAERLSVIVPRLKGFRLLRRIAQAYACGKITRPIIIGSDASVSMAELWPENGFLVGEEHSASMGPADRCGPAIMKLHTSGVTNFYVFSLP